MRDRVHVRLPGGFWLDGNCHRDVVLRTFTGHDEEALVHAAGTPPAALVSDLLARCVERLGTLDAPSVDTLAHLTVGDREALLLHLCRLVLGPAVQALVRCDACGEQADVSLTVDDLLQPPYEDSRPDYDIVFDTQAGAVRVRYRLPTGADQLAAVPLAARSLAAAHTFLLRRCVVACEVADGAPVSAEEIHSVLASRLPDVMAARDAQAESILAFTCPACAHAGQALFDAAEWLFGSLDVRRGDLFRQVHRLAIAYHWSEADILALPWPRRQRYLDLLAEVSA